ncbi:hypothetical protein [Paraflavitalea speifideaquila]|uniref:hypothetical protein n=1 Tax=Paraflavitalea speifideaquila TaxID=3076558 RepID=UPI0028ED0EE6|nr:hypothetical protein [Paraflavitalea speifideiaquila]
MTITEPFVEVEGSVFTQVDSTHVLMRVQSQAVHVGIKAGNARLYMGRNAANYRMPYPAVKAYPIEFEIVPPGKGFTQEVRYRIWVD